MLKPWLSLVPLAAAGLLLCQCAGDPAPRGDVSSASATPAPIAEAPPRTERFGPTPGMGRVTGGATGTTEILDIPRR